MSHKTAAVAFSVLMGAAALFAQQKPASTFATLAEIKMEFVAIPAGDFMMGCSPGDKDCTDPEKPLHHVRLTRGFEMGKYEVTQAQWEAVMGANPSYFRGRELPVDQANFIAVQEFLRVLNARKDGYVYRLPTEAEWEYAARAGTTGPHPIPPDEAGWHVPNAGGTTHPVGLKKANAWGLYDMWGNVWEYCQDWYDPNYYKTSPETDPKGPATGQAHVRRGGSWNTPNQTTPTVGRITFRQQNDLYTHVLGVRVVREKQ